MKRTVTVKVPVMVKVELEVELDGAWLKHVGSELKHVSSPTIEDIKARLQALKSEVKYLHTEGHKPLLAEYMVDLLKEAGDVVHYATRGKSKPICGAESERYCNDIHYIFHQLGEGNGGCQACIDFVDRAIEDA